MQLGFVIDHSRCIGCHACTVACKSENDVPLGEFRTWVKYTEEGTFPQVKRSFAVLRCNQCTDAPCVTICPVTALAKRDDGIVDVDPQRCIGCKGCMQACPYDALYINSDTGTAEKCHFCAHRTERGLAPACAVVCPTEAIIPGDFHDPESMVSRLKREHDLTARKTEAGTGPNVLYREVAEAGINPLHTDASGGYLWSNRAAGMDLAAEEFLAEQRVNEERAQARTTYDVDHRPLWGWKVSAYLWTKSLAAGILLMLALAQWFTGAAALSGDDTTVLRLGSFAFLAVTAALLVADLKKPGRFLYIMLRPNWDSWLVRGSYILVGFGGLVTLGLLAPNSFLGGRPMTAVAALLAALTAAYTGWLFAQSKGRVLWMRPNLWLHLIVQAVVAGSGFVLLASAAHGWSEEFSDFGRRVITASLVVHLGFLLTEHASKPRRREAEYERVARLITHGPFARRRWTLVVGTGVALPLVLLWLAPSGLAWSVAGALALLGLLVEEDILVRAGQASPIS